MGVGGACTRVSQPGMPGPLLTPTHLVPFQRGGLSRAWPARRGGGLAWPGRSGPAAAVLRARAPQPGATAADAGGRAPARQQPGRGDRLVPQIGRQGGVFTRCQGRARTACWPCLWAPSDTPSPCSTSPSPNLTAPRRRGRSPSTSPTSAVTAPRAASIASSSTSPGEPCPRCPALTAARPTVRVFTPTSSPRSPPQVSCPGAYSASRVQVWVLACPLLPGNLGVPCRNPVGQVSTRPPFLGRSVRGGGGVGPEAASPVIRGAHLTFWPLAAVGMSTWTAWAASRTKSQCAPRTTPTRRHGRAWRRPRRRRGAEGPLSSSLEAATWVRIGGRGLVGVLCLLGSCQESWRASGPVRSRNRSDGLTEAGAVGSVLRQQVLLGWCPLHSESSMD